MSTPKLHHYVPQFHLRRFANTKGHIWVWDKTSSQIFAASPERVAAETQFYRLTQYESDGHDPMAMEKQLSAIEGEVAKITAQWLEWLPNMVAQDVVPIPRVNRRIFAQFLAIQFLRTRDTREIFSALVASKRGASPTPTEERELHTELMWDRTLIERLATRLRRSVWLFARNNTATPFVTSDNPIAFRTGDNRQWLRLGILSRSTYVVYPMSPRVVLYCYPRQGKFRALGKFADTVSPVCITEEMVESENSGQVFMSRRFLFSARSQFKTEQAFATTIGTDIFAPTIINKSKEGGRRISRKGRKQSPLALREANGK